MKKSKIKEQESKEIKAKWIEMSKVITFLESKELEIKECICEGTRVEYVKGVKLEEKIKANLEEVCKQVNSIMGTNISHLKPPVAIQEIYSQFKSVGLISKGTREEGDKRKNVKRLLPYETLAIYHQCNCAKSHKDMDNPDHVKKLDLATLNSFDPEFFYILNIHRGKSKLYLYLFLIIFCIFLYVLMPIWPYKMKVVVYWVSYYLLIAILALYAVRLLIFILFYSIGYSIWILPDLDAPDLGFFECFMRLISVEKRDDKWYLIVLRVILVIVFGYIAFCVYKNPGLIDDTVNFVSNAMKDLYKYGENKFVNNNSTALSMKNKKKYISLEDLDNF